MTPMTTNQDLNPDRLRAAFGIFPSGVVALAAEVDARAIGLAASSFTSVSLDPPLVSVNLANTSKTWPHLRRSTHIGVTVLANDQEAACRQLAGPVDRRFDGIPFSVSPGGAITLDDGLARFDCTIYREVEAGDHVLVLLRLHAAEHVGPGQDANPLVFHRSGFGRLEQPPAPAHW